MSEDQKPLGADAAAVETAGQVVSDAAPHVAHTPGPWWVVVKGPYLIDTHQGIAAQVYWEADANLIAAAPEMYEALQAALNGPFSCPSVMVDHMRAAVAKAGGLHSYEDAADEHLRAAAPDLLKACKEFVRKCENGEAISRRSYAEMSAAIAKAEGR